MKNISPIVWISLVLLVIGGINWGLVGLFEFDLVAAMAGKDFGETTTITRVVYTLVGASAFLTLIGLAMSQAGMSKVEERGSQTRLSNN
jgi:uncharacterized membrane protein YuzA (DUF378 family)